MDSWDGIGVCYFAFLMNQRALLSLGVLLGAAYGKSPQAWLNQAHESLRAYQAKDPANAAVSTVALGAVLFYLAERGKNPKVTSLNDALVYVSTNISVGYCDIFARTPLGKVIGSILMTYGPALAARALDPPEAEATPPATDANLKLVAGKLEEILVELRRQGLASEIDG